MSGGWIKDHKRELMAALAIGGAGAGGLGLAGLLGSGVTAASAGAVAGEAFLPGALGVGGANAAVAGDAFLPGLLGAGGTGASTSDALLANLPQGGLLDRLAGANWGKGAETAGKLALFGQRSGMNEPPQQRPMAPPMGVQPLQQSQGIPPMSSTYPTDVMDPEKRRRLMALMQMRGGYGSA